MDPQTLDRLELELECKRLADEGRIVRIPGEEPDDIELAQIARYSNGGIRISLREDVDVDVAKKVAALDPVLAFERPEILADAFMDAQVTWERMRSYVFPTELDAPLDVVRLMPDPSQHPEDDELRADRPLFTAVVDGERVSYCCSSRENDRAAEAWVETVPAYRRRGYAAKVVAAWASDARNAGRVAFYSHRDDNVASARVAQRLELVPWLYLVNFEISEAATGSP